MMFYVGSSTLKLKVYSNEIYNTVSALHNATKAYH